MDGLSGAASVMAAVSLTIQLVSTVNTLREFWAEMQSAGEDIAEVVDDLALLNCILDGVKRAYVRRYHAASFQFPLLFLIYFVSGLLHVLPFCY